MPFVYCTEGVVYDRTTGIRIHAGQLKYLTPDEMSKAVVNTAVSNQVTNVVGTTKLLRLDSMEALQKVPNIVAKVSEFVETTKPIPWDWISSELVVSKYKDLFAKLIPKREPVVEATVEEVEPIVATKPAGRSRAV